jgi:hypothetical protein
MAKLITQQGTENMDTCAVCFGKSNLDFPRRWNSPWSWRNWSRGRLG